MGWNVGIAQTEMSGWHRLGCGSGRHSLGCLEKKGPTKKERKEIKAALVGQGIAPDHIFQARSQAAWRMLIKTSALPGGCTEVLQIMVLPGALVQIN